MRRSILLPSSPSPSLLKAITCLLLASTALGQTSNLFKWSFEDTSIQTTIPACKDLPISISGNRGVAPYYMIALAVDGTPTTTLIGTSDDELSYQVRHPVGTRLLLSVADSAGNPGGTFAPMTVVAENSTACINTPPTSPTFTVHTNVTRSGDLREASTCDVLALVVNGGTGPYNIMAIASSSPAVTNATMPAEDNVFSYVNRALPGGFLVAAVSDLTGRWATGTPLFATKGSTAADCPGLVSSSRKDDNPPADPSPSTGGGDNGGNTGSDPTPGTGGNGNGGTGNPGNTPPDPGNTGNNGNTGGNTNNGNTGGNTNNGPGPGTGNTSPPNNNNNNNGNGNTPGNSNNANGADNATSAEKTGNNVPLIVGLSAGLGGALVLAVGVTVIVYVRKKMRVRELEDEVILGFSGTKGPAGMKPGAVY